MIGVWKWLQDRLGIAEVSHRQECMMGKFADEMDDLRRRIAGLGEAQATSAANLQSAITGLEEKIADLQNGDLDAEQQALVDGMKADVDALRDAANAADDGYEPPVVEPAPVPGVEGEPAPGSVEDRQRGGI